MSMAHLILETSEDKRRNREAKARRVARLKGRMREE